MKFTVVGFGFVGKAIHHTLSKKHDVYIIDPALGYEWSTEKEQVDGVILCLPAPTKMHGVVDHSLLVDYIDELPKDIPILIKSTITPRFAQAYVHGNVSFSPEFLTAKNSIEDFENSEFMIFSGGSASFWHDVFIELPLPKLEKISILSPVEASIAKYTINSFLATKVSFMNEIYDLAYGYGAGFDHIMEAVHMDKRMGTSHYSVPGYDGQRGWGGACFPKDTHAFKNIAQHQMVELSVLEAAIEANKKWRIL